MEPSHSTNPSPRDGRRHPLLDEAQGKALLRYAREAIREALGGPLAQPPIGDWTSAPGATFVTLTRHGALHGCIGSLLARRPLCEDVAENAVAAALYDPRSSPLQAHDVDQIDVEVSLLSPLEPLHFTSEATAIAALRPYIDGVVIRYRNNQGAFLPQVWETLPHPEEFFTHLKLKAGLPPDFWAFGLELYRFTVEKWKDPARPGDTLPRVHAVVS